jgi:hypothetical protein
MVMFFGDQSFGKKDRKNHVDRQGEKQYFSLGA